MGFIPIVVKKCKSSNTWVKVTKNHRILSDKRRNSEEPNLKMKFEEQICDWNTRNEIG